MAAQISKRDQPGTQRDYETIFILRPDTQNDGIAAVNGKIKSVIEGLAGKVLKLDNWGKRKLAYEVKGQLKGIYLYWRYLGNAGTVDELERNLRMQDAVIRYYTVKVDEDVVPDARPTEVTDETWAKAATTGPDEEEIVTGQAPRFASDGDDEDDYVAPGAEAILAEIPPEEKALLEKPPVKEEV
ncbi:MAG: 30S ribosomal protein S6 [Deltaproteobacteria bacterium]|nr:30S ribosomal protein S6 [Deltaproteobacteria bacterium]